jgi:hypothetical protein
MLRIAEVFDALSTNVVAFKIALDNKRVSKSVE